jgi:hypothetical protein
MKLKFWWLLIGFLCFPVQLSAQNSGTGVGVIMGEPTGISAKTWLSGKSAVAGAAAWSFLDDGSLQVHADYLLHNRETIRVEKGTTLLHYGVGGRMKISDNSRMGIRIPVGVTWLVPNDPIDIFVEIAPLVDLAPETEFTLNGGVGIRYYFR